jgi:arylsulfatase
MDTPFQYVKAVASHFGGTRNPLLISWPARIKDTGGLRSQFHHVIDLAPTLLEAAGVQAPDVLNGIAQTPIEGVSMTYTFDDAKAPERRRLQMFEMFANRGIYQNGWFASSVALIPWEAATQGKVDFEKLTWELYHIDQDFSQADDLAAKYPEQVRALEQLWWAEAARNNVLPVDTRGPERMSDQIMGRPSLAAGRKTFVYPTPLATLPEASSPDLKNTSFTVTAEAEIPAGGADGMIYTQGGFTGGWGFYLQQGKLVGLHSYVARERYRVVSREPVPTGKVTLAMDFAYDGGGMGKGGTLTLLVNGRKVGEGRVDKTTPYKYALAEGQSIGEDAGSPIDFSYTPPFPFTGTLGTVTVELKH